MNRCVLALPMAVLMLGGMISAEDAAPKHYFAGPQRQMRAGAVRVGESALGGESAATADSRYGQPTGVYYFTGRKAWGFPPVISALPDEIPPSVPGGRTASTPSSATQFQKGILPPSPYYFPWRGPVRY